MNTVSVKVHLFVGTNILQNTLIHMLLNSSSQNQRKSCILLDFHFRDFSERENQHLINSNSLTVNLLNTFHYVDFIHFRCDHVKGCVAKPSTVVIITHKPGQCKKLCTYNGCYHYHVFMFLIWCCCSLLWFFCDIRFVFIPI